MIDDLRSHALVARAASFTTLKLRASSSKLFKLQVSSFTSSLLSPTALWSHDLTRSPCRVNRFRTAWGTVRARSMHTIHNQQVAPSPIERSSWSLCCSSSSALSVFLSHHLSLLESEYPKNESIWLGMAGSDMFMGTVGV